MLYGLCERQCQEWHVALVKASIRKGSISSSMLEWWEFSSIDQPCKTSWSFQIFPHFLPITLFPMCVCVCGIYTYMHAFQYRYPCRYVCMGMQVYEDQSVFTHQPLTYKLRQGLSLNLADSSTLASHLAPGKPLSLSCLLNPWIIGRLTHSPSIYMGTKSWTQALVLDPQALYPLSHLLGFTLPVYLESWLARGILHR